LDITVKVPSHVEVYLRNYAATLFYDTSEYALSRAILVALISKLDEMCLISPEEVVAGVMKDRVVEVPPSILTEQYIPIERTDAEEYALQVAMVGGTPPVKKPKPSVKVESGELKSIPEMRGDQVSYTWIVWGWAMGSTLNEVTLESGARKWHCFEYRNVVEGVKQRKGVTIKDTTIYGALTTLVDRNWLTMNDKREYSLTEAAKKWVLKRQSQEYLIEKSFLDPIEGVDLRVPVEAK